MRRCRILTLSARNLTDGMIFCGIRSDYNFELNVLRHKSAVCRGNDLISEEYLYRGIISKDVFDNFNRLYGNEYLLRNDDRKILFMEMQLKYKESLNIT